MNSRRSTGWSKTGLRPPPGWRLRWCRRWVSAWRSRWFMAFTNAGRMSWNASSDSPVSCWKTVGALASFAKVSISASWYLVRWLLAMIHRCLFPIKSNMLAERIEYASEIADEQVFFIQVVGIKRGSADVCAIDNMLHRDLVIA